MIIGTTVEDVWLPALIALVIGFLIGWLIFGRRLRTRSRMLSQQIDEKQREFDNTSRELGGSQTEVQSLLAVRSAHEAQLADFEASTAKLSADRAEAEQRVAGLEGELSAARHQHSVVNSRLVNLQSDHAALGSTSKQLRASLEELQGEVAQISALHARIGELEPQAVKLVELQSRHAELGTVAVSLRTRALDLETTKGSLDMELGEWRSRAAHSAAEVEELRTRIADMEAVHGDLQRDVEGWRGRCTVLEAEAAQVAGLRSRVGELQAEAGRLPGLRSRLAELEVDAADVPGLRARNSALDTQVAELKAELDHIGSEAKGLQSLVAEIEGPASEVPQLRESVVRLEADVARSSALSAELHARNVELEAQLGIHREELGGLQTQVTSFDSDARGLRGQLAESQNQIGLLSWDVDNWRKRAEASAADGEALRQRIAELEGDNLRFRVADLGAGAEVLGYTIKLDDLKVVEGIGPAIEALCHDREIRTWRLLGDTSPEVLREMLDAAGPHYRVHEPSTWPEQASLLARGRWAEFKDLTDRLKGGREL